MQILRPLYPVNADMPATMRTLYREAGGGAPGGVASSTHGALVELVETLARQL